MSIPLAIPVLAICLEVTTPGIDDGPNSRVAQLEFIACVKCNEDIAPCKVPPEFRDLYLELNKEPKARPKGRPAPKIKR